VVKYEQRRKSTGWFVTSSNDSFDHKTNLLVLDTYNQTFGLGNHICPGKYLAIAILHKVIPLLLSYFDWEFEDPKAERKEECMFGVRWKDVGIKWIRREAYNAL
jgi:cytochrome P450